MLKWGETQSTNGELTLETTTPPLSPVNPKNYDTEVGLLFGFGGFFLAVMLFLIGVMVYKSLKVKKQVVEDPKFNIKSYRREMIWLGVGIVICFIASLVMFIVGGVINNK
ncbi:hypothetical protein [Mesoplasma lactucae]|uniref:Uncharacterized protein n=1 Tax=Mesoplasma lactucae ATCC 49193 TaxID=81460 RepID=A0A291IRS4_9MOLU|nr:hypothetical protein [Mesoplasma lactucae]ATG97460.1 hypothetical protein CP520_01655 [Mesoplasma lactucae ATCC 49193]ATZ20085.1 hypothetical protein MLACT_v1c02640 [Mesoplasma lactucae ATCC 49193]MCL8216833.1 hypothetical protein [Mesoplasma lactucae ATCC 49193]